MQIVLYKRTKETGGEGAGGLNFAKTQEVFYQGPGQRP
jgi:hypothetical protein